MKFEPHDMDLALIAYFDAMRKDYGPDWNKPYGDSGPGRFDLVCDKAGQKFQRIINVGGSQRSSHSFIVLKDCTVKTMPGSKHKTLTLRVGDILKCASWKAPALNFVRGNILDGNYGNCRWTGAN